MTDHPLLSDVSNWRLWGRWMFSVFGSGPWECFSASAAYRSMVLPDGFKGYAFNMDGYVYALEADHQLFQTFILEKFNQDRSWFDNFFKVCEQSLAKANVLENHHDMLAALLAYEDMASCSMIIHFCSTGLETAIPLLAQESGLSSDQFAKALVPYKPTLVMQYKAELAELKESEIELFLKKYQWIGANYMTGDRLAKKDIISELGTVAPPVEALDLSPLSPEVREKIIILQKLIYYRSINAETISKTMNIHWEDFDQLAGRDGKTRADLDNLTTREIINLIQGGGWPTDFKDRGARSGISYIDGQVKLYFGAELDRHLKVFEPKVAADQQSVKGNVAFKGKIIGVVRIVEKISDLQKINEGDVMIANETMPEYIVGMKKAGAFVTNQGGITSHAAIVARELRKPCIIGTRVATKIFKDGDVVEVDAERGIVTIIGRGDTAVAEEINKTAIGPEYVEGRDTGIVKIIK